MTRFPPTRFPPGFFDLPPDAGQRLPLDVIAAWTRGPQTRERARELLAPCTLRGLVVSTDTAGLTRLSQERSLIEILAMVSRPKELVHAYGRALGGQAIGVWAADNTEMFYPEGVAPAHVVGMLLALMDRIAADCEVGIGGCVHTGVFYELGQALYGPDADRVEAIAEDYTAAGELVLTGEAAASLGADAGFRLERRADLAARFGVVERVVDGPRLEGIAATDFRYPLPFTEEFFGGLGQWQRSRRTSQVPRPAYREAAIVVVEQAREDSEVPELAALNDLALAAAVARLGHALSEDLPGGPVKTVMGVGIYRFDDARHAVAFARKLREALAGQGVPLRIGIDVGRVLEFELGPGLHDLAGSPVNVASKLAQDAGVFGAIHVSAAAARQAGLPDITATVPLKAGSVTLEAVVL